MFRVLLLLATFMQVYFNLLNLQQMIIINGSVGSDGDGICTVGLNCSAPCCILWLEDWIKPRKLEKFPRATFRKVQWRPGLVRRVLVKRIVWISVRHNGELKVRSSLYVAKPCRCQEICVSSNLVSTYYWQLSIVFYLFCPIWRAPRQDIGSIVLMSCEARMSLSAT